MGPWVITGGLFALGLAVTEADVDEVVVEGRRLSPSNDSTAAASVRDTPDRLHAFTDLGTVLRTVPGVQVQRAGAPGSFLGVSIRGATFQQTSVFIGDLEISGPDSGAFDLGIFPPDLFEAVEVYRGGAPAWLSSGAVGGVVRLVPLGFGGDEPSSAAVQAGYGSYDSSYASMRARDAEGALRTTATGGVLHADNDFRYVDDGGTRFAPADDVARRRLNADLTQVHGAQYSELEVGPGRASAVALAVHRDRGEPGNAAIPATRTRRQRTYVFAAGGYTADLFVGSAPLRLQLVGGLGLDHDEFADPLGQIGQFREDTTTDLWSGQLRAAAALVLPLGLEATIVTTARWEGLSSDNQLSNAQIPDANRATQALAFELAGRWDLGDRRLVVRGSARAQATQARTAEFIIREDLVRTDVDRVDPTFRGAARLELIRHVDLVGSVASGVRLPSTQELFGDRAVLRGNPALRPEDGVHADVGVMAHGRWGEIHATGEVRAFGLWLDDLIRLRQNSRRELISENIERGEILGVEAGGVLGVTEHLSLSGAVTALRSADERGNQLPFRAPLVAYAGLDARSGALGPVDDLSGFIEVAHRSSLHIDPANLQELEARTTVDVGLEVTFLDGSSQLYAEVRDLFDVAGFDLLSFPLPGRRFEAGIQLRQTW